jgi:hypothetical protein
MHASIVSEWPTVQEQLGKLTLRRNADLSRLAPAQLQSAVVEDVFQRNSGQCAASRAMHAMTEAGMRIPARRAVMPFLLLLSLH